MTRFGRSLYIFKQKHIGYLEAKYPCNWIKPYFFFPSNILQSEKKQLREAAEAERAILDKSSLDIDLVEESEEDKRLAGLLKYSVTTCKYCRNCLCGQCCQLFTCLYSHLSVFVFFAKYFTHAQWSLPNAAMAVVTVYCC